MRARYCRQITKEQVNMNGMHIPRTPIVVDYWRLRKVPPRALFFLTHFHADHTSGLSAQWPYPIHCTHITACLLREKFKIRSELIVELEVGESRILHVDTLKERVSVSVSVLDANHCPGSAMFLFAGYFGRILYTGDFRYSPEMHSLPELTQSSAIDLLYLDNTYCHRSCQFPSREQATNMVVGMIREHRAHTVLIGLHSLGKEELLVAIAKQLGVWVGVSPERYGTLQLLKADNVFTTDMDSCFVKVLPFHVLVNTLQMDKADSGVLGVLPTCVFTGSNGPAPPSHPSIKVVPYSDHSSYDELLHFVRLVRPRSVQGIVKSLTSRCNMEVFNHLLDSTPAADYEIPDGIAQLLSVQSREHPPIPSHDCRHKVSPTVMTINNRGRKRAVGVCYLSPPKKRNSHDEKGEIKHVPWEQRSAAVLWPKIRALSKSIRSTIFYGTDPGPSRPIKIDMSSFQDVGKGEEIVSRGDMPHPPISRGDKPHPPVPSLKSLAVGRRRNLGVHYLGDEGRGSQNDVETERLENEKTENARSECGERAERETVSKVVDGGEAKRQLLATLDRLLGINDQSELSSPPATIGLPTTLLDTIDNLLEL